MRGTRGRFPRGAAALGVVLGGGLGALSCGDFLGSNDLQIADCDEGEVRCSGNTPERCARGGWVTEEDCGARVCDVAAGGCLGECTDGKSRCLTNLNTSQLCISGEWTTAALCDHQTCDPDTGVCVGECAPADRRCGGNTPQHCDAGGQWEPDPTPCGEGKHCSGGACVANCVPGDLHCLGNLPQVCNGDGNWQDDDAGACVSSTCLDGVCAGECALGDARCQGDVPEACDVNGQWQPLPSCAPSSCAAGSCVRPSCEGLATTCGPAAESCCVSPVVWGGSFNKDNNGAFPATVSDFRLDRFEVTIGRFRAFLAGYPGNKPEAGDGAHPEMPGSGWDPAWDALLPPDKASVEAALSDPYCVPPYGTWTPQPEGSENRPMGCVDWFLASAFCIWDGGRLPSDAERNYAAAAGAEQRFYPWSNPPTSSSIDPLHAVYDGDLPEDVGSRSPLGDGKWRQADLAGNVEEWTLDYFPSRWFPEGGARSLRGGTFYDLPLWLFTFSWWVIEANYYDPSVGFRCARPL